MNGTRLVNIKELESRSGVPVRTIRTLYHGRKIPYIKAGHRTVLFDPQKVMAALQRFEVRPVG